MNSTNHSSDVPMTNHHSETTSKSLKRSRSPSLVHEERSDETPTKKNRKRRTTTDIDQSLGKHITAEKIYVYRWPVEDSHADLHVLQEQICDFLSLKSFKRKYPDISRRIVDVHEREYLKSENAVSETQCDLGLTALKLDEVLQIMADDYPEKCHQFNSVWQQKRRALVATNNNNPHLSSFISTSMAKESTKPHSSNEHSDNHNRVAKVRHDLLRSTVDYNTQLQRERLQERKACFDLQTMQIHYPANRQFRLPANRTTIGSYPLALLPGQYQDSYRKYQAEELKYMPINTALYYYPKPLSLVHTDRFSQQNNSSDEEEEKESTRPRTPLVTTNGQSRLTAKPSTPVAASSLCYICKIKQEDQDDDLVTCSSCQHSHHPLCLDVNQEMLTIIKTYPWQCIDCKSCTKCAKTHDEANMMFCDRCDRGYHTYCVGLEAIPDGSWQCSACDSPSPVSPTKAKRGRPSIASRLSPQPIKSEPLPPPPTRVSSRRSRKILSTPLSPSNNTNHSSNSSSLDLLPTNSSSSSSMNLILTRHQQQWTTTAPTEIKSKT